MVLLRSRYMTLPTHRKIAMQLRLLVTLQPVVSVRLLIPSRYKNAVACGRLGGRHAHAAEYSLHEIQSHVVDLSTWLFADPISSVIPSM